MPKQQKTNLIALSGGEPVRKDPFSPWPYFAADEITAVNKVLRSGKVNYWTGEECKHFEKEFADYHGRKHGIALANGTVALELALYSLGIGVGDEVIIPCRTFIATASAVVTRGAIPVMADIDRASQNITAETIQAVITPSTKAIIVVHLAGWPCDMDSIIEVAKRHDLKIVEDCAQTHGAIYKDKRAGSFGDAAAFSFCQDKIMTTGGEGGMLLMDDCSVWKNAWSYKEHGKSYDAVFSREHITGFRWVHESFGTNLRMTEMQAAIGRQQLKKLQCWIEKRRSNAERLTECFSEIPALRVTIPPNDIEHAYYKYYVFVRPELLQTGWTRDRIIQAINAEGIPCATGSCPEIYLEKAFEHNNLQPVKRMPNARELSETSLMFFVHPTLGYSEISDTCCAVRKVLEEATR